MFVLEDLAILTATGHFNNHITNAAAGYCLIPCEWMSKFLPIYHVMTELCSYCQKGTINHKKKPSKNTEELFWEVKCVYPKFFSITIEQ